MGHDLRLAVRALVRQPLASLVVIVCLAVGIGANASMFSVVNATILNLLPFRDADRLVTVSSTQPEGGVRRGGTSFADLRDYQEQVSAFETLAGVQTRSLTFSDYLSRHWLGEPFFTVPPRPLASESRHE